MNCTLQDSSEVDAILNFKTTCPLLMTTTAFSFASQPLSTLKKDQHVSWMDNKLDKYFDEHPLNRGPTLSLTSQRENQRRTPSVQTLRPRVRHLSVTAHPLLFPHPRKEIIATELGSITRQVGGSRSMIKVCVVSNTGLEGLGKLHTPEGSLC